MIKKHLLLIISRALVGACQHKAPSAKEQPRVAATALTPAHAAAATPMPSLFTAADTLTRPMRQLLSQYDLSKLWQGDTEERRTNPTMEGFFGPDHYRFALVFNEVKRDEQHPEVYHVRGKCRYRKNIRLFSGFLTVQTVKDLARGNFFLTGPGQDLPDTATAVTYTARARMHLTEESSANSGVFEGESILDFYTNSAPTPIGYVTGSLGIDESMPARGSGSLLRGKRRNVTTRQVKSFVASTDVFAAAPDVNGRFRRWRPGWAGKSQVREARMVRNVGEQRVVG